MQLWFPIRPGRLRCSDHLLECRYLFALLFKECDDNRMTDSEDDEGDLDHGWSLRQA